MGLKDAIDIMISFATLVIALLAYIAISYKRK